MNKIIVVIEGGMVASIFAREPDELDILVVDCDSVSVGDALSEKELLPLLGDEPLQEVSYNEQTYDDYKTNNSVIELLTNKIKGGKIMKSTIKSKWKVTANPIGDKLMYAVFRILDVDKIDCSSNREIWGEYIEDRKEAEKIANEKNREEEELERSAKNVT